MYSRSILLIHIFLYEKILAYPKGSGSHTEVIYQAEPCITCNTHNYKDRGWSYHMLIGYPFSMGTLQCKASRSFRAWQINRISSTNMDQLIYANLVTDKYRSIGINADQ